MPREILATQEPPQLLTDQFGGRVPPPDDLKNAEIIWRRPINTSDVLQLIDDKEKMFLLPQTGFDIRRQIDMWTKIIAEQREVGKSNNEILEEIIDRNQEDAVRFCFEYIYSDLALDIPVRFQYIDGIKRIAPNNYGDGAYLDTINSVERRGAVKKAVEKTEEYLTNTTPGSMVVIISPDGWTGVSDHDGKSVPHKESQTYVFRVNNEGKLEGITLRTDMKLKQNEELSSLLQGEDHLDISETKYEERIIQVVENVIFLDGQSKGHTYEDVINRIAQVKGSVNAFESKIDDQGNLQEARTFDEMRENVRTRKDLSRLGDIAIRLLEEHKQQILQETNDLTPEQLKRMAISLGRTILKIFEMKHNDSSRNSSSGEKQSTRTIQSLLVSPQIFSHPREFENRYEDKLTNLQQLGGCSGGACSISPGSGSPVVSINIGPGTAIKVVNENVPFTENCPNCGESVKAVVKRGEIHCLSCKATAKKPSSIKVIR